MPLHVLLAAALLRPTPAFSSQTLVRSDFEGPFAANGIAEGWQDNSYTNWGTKDIAFAREAENPHSGAACQRLTLNRMGYISPERQGWADMGAVQLITQDPVALTKGTVYRARAWLRASGPIGVNVHLRQAASPWKAYIEQTVIVGSQWQPLEYLGLCSTDDPQTLFMVRFSDLGTVWLDDISLEALSPEEVAALTPPAAAGNLLQNPSFDLDRANWLGDIGWDRLADPQYAIDTDGGDPCLKVSAPGAPSVGLVSDVVAITPGRPFSVRCRLRAEQGSRVRIRAVLMHAAHAMWPYVWIDGEIGPEWKTLEGSGPGVFTPGISHAFLVFEFFQPGPVWVDDVSLRQDESSADVPVPRAAIIPDRHPFNWYHDGAHPTLRVLASAPEGVAPPPLAWRVTDFAGRTVLSDRWRPPGERAEKRIDASALPRGWYHCEVQWEHGGRSYRNESAFCVLPPAERRGDIESSPFGGHFQIGPAHLDLARAIGARWMRLWPPMYTTWSSVEPEKGQWAFRDEEIRALAHEKGLRLCGVLESPPGWARGDAPDYWQDWESYVSTVVSRYRSEIGVWEVENEPGLRWWRSKPDGPSRADTHRQALEHSYEVIKRENPEAVVLGGCVAGDFASRTDSLEFGRELIANGALSLMDALSLHYYHSYSYALPMDEQAESTLDSTAHFRELMRAAGRDLPIINSEGGVYNPGPCLSYRPCAPDNYAPLPPELVARLLARMYVTQIAAGLQRFYYYNLFIDGVPVAKAWESLVEGDGQPRPAVAAYATLSWLLDGATFERVERPDQDLWLYRFATPSGPLVAAWTRTGTAREAPFPQAAEAWDLMGRDLPVKGKLRLTPNPTYVLLKDGR
jgi:hypothetical protein